MRFVFFAVTASLVLAGLVCADENVRGVQEKLRDGGFYSGEIDGAYSAELSAALTRYQIRKGLPVSGQLDVETSEALGAKPAVGPSSPDAEQSSQTWRRLRSGKHRTSSGRRSETAATEAQETSSPGPEETESSTETQPRSAPAAKAQISSDEAGPESSTAPVASERKRRASAPPATGRSSSETTEPVSAASAAVVSSSEDGAVSTEQLRDYIGAFVLAGLDPNVGSEAEFFADRVKYYDQGVMDREKIRNDLRDYAARWPQRRFWFAGNITIEPQRRKRIRVTFPLRYELRNGATSSSGTINKTVVLEHVGDDLQIVAVSEEKAE
jgi:peptidoglycan hydrolase-like protein with peptidoglycan-binding domain